MVELIAVSRSARNRVRSVDEVFIVCFSLLSVISYSNGPVRKSHACFGPLANIDRFVMIPVGTLGAVINTVDLQEWMPVRGKLDSGSTLSMAVQSDRFEEIVGTPHNDNISSVRPYASSSAMTPGM